MYAIDDPTAVAVAPAVPLATAAGQGFFTAGNPQAGTPATVVPDWWLNQQQGELLSITDAAALVRQKGVLQVLPALRTLFGGIGSLASHGYMGLAGGLIVQWGSQNTVTGFLDQVNFPIAFPNNIFSVVANEGNAVGWGSPAAPTPTVYGCNRLPVALSGFQVSAIVISRTGVPVSAGGLTFDYIALGD